MASVTFRPRRRASTPARRPAVDALDLQIDDGELLVLVGPSGSGKSTALRMLAGLEPLDAGRSTSATATSAPSAPRDRDIAMVFQNYALYPQLTVAENMGFALKQQGVPKAERIIQVREAARILDLEPYLDRKPKHLSGGQRQRVAMGRAIVRHPQVYLMDEPLSNLDAKLRVQTRTELAELQARLAVTTVYVTHDQVEAMTMGIASPCSRTACCSSATPRTTLYHEPANLFVAGFIGSPAMNLVTRRGPGRHRRHRWQRASSPRRRTPPSMASRATGRARLPARVGGDRRRDPGGRSVSSRISAPRCSSTSSSTTRGSRVDGRQGSAPFPGIVGEATSIRIAGAVHVFDPGGQRLTTSRSVCASLPG